MMPTATEKSTAMVLSAAVAATVVGVALVASSKRTRARKSRVSSSSSDIAAPGTRRDSEDLPPLGQPINARMEEEAVLQWRASYRRYRLGEGEGAKGEEPLRYSEEYSEEYPQWPSKRTTTSFSAPAVKLSPAPVTRRQKKCADKAWPEKPIRVDDRCGVTSASSCFSRSSDKCL